MNELVLLAERYPDLNLTVKAKDLTEMARFIVLETKREIEKKLTEAAEEKYLTQQQAAEILDVHRATLHNWQKQDYLKHVEIGGKRRYRMSDIQRILDGGR